MKPPLVAIIGPTASGKTALSLHLASAFDIEVINADSRQVYRGMDIGTAKPTAQERALVPHHLIDIVEPDGEFSLALFLDLARKTVAEVQGRGRLPVVVGGTGQYAWGLLEGWQAPGVPPDPVLRERLTRRAREEGSENLFAELVAVDPGARSLIDPRNVRRVVRALEVYYATGVPSSQQRARGEPPFRALVLGLDMPRKELYGRIDARLDAMLKAGWIEEVRSLLERGYSAELPSMSSTGYRELALYLRGELAWEEALRRARRGLRRLARHQGAWFRISDPRIRWLDARSDPAPAAREAVRRLLADGEGVLQ
ncbi:MAG: tRNA (adenosine(37)-N6)-dimethylallyltransferase MiaA [Chloroflexi bacterium]|nr:tRNA (adenosine(37)-N6)-dimethylallyltransferase MiaA [Chloroflexota bacterium]